MHDLTDEEFDRSLEDVRYYLALYKAEIEREKQERVEAERAEIEDELSSARDLASEADALTQNLKGWF